MLDVCQELKYSLLVSRNTIQRVYCNAYCALDEGVEWIHFIEYTWNVKHQFYNILYQSYFCGSVALWLGCWTLEWKVWGSIIS